MPPTRRSTGLRALDGIVTVPLDDPARRAAREPGPPDKDVPPRRAADMPTVSSDPPAGPRPRRAARPRSGPVTDDRGGRNSSVPRSYMVPRLVADALRGTARSLGMSDSSLTNLLLASSLSDHVALAGYAADYITWRSDADPEVRTPVRISTQTPMETVAELETITRALSGAGGTRESRFSRSAVVATVLFAHLAEPDLDALRTLRKDERARDLEHRLDALRRQDAPPRDAT
jgi:hypothetical protein